MALIDCPGCGNKVSDRAKACPKCGMNLSLKKKQEEQLKEVKHNNLKVDEQPKQLDQPKVQTEELKKIKEEETDKPIFKEEVKEERTSKPNLEEKTKEPEKIISKEISEPEKKKKGNKFWLAIGLIIGFILGVLFWFVLALIIPDDKIPFAGGNTGTTVVGGTDSQSTENSGSSKKTDVSGATLAFKYVDVSLIPNGLGEGTYKVGKDIDPGEYIAYGLNSVSQIKQFNSLDEQEDTEEIDGLFIDLTLEENQYIEVESGIILPKSTFVCFDIKQLGKQLKKLGMLIVQDQVWNRVTVNRAERKSTRYYMDEFHLLLKEEQTAAYSVEIWKRFRKWGGIPTAITQNVKDLLASREVENIFGATR